MTAHPPLPLQLQPASKGSSTAKSSPLSAVASSKPNTSRSSSPVRPARTRQNANSEEFISDKATTTMIRRVLGPQSGIDPTSSPKPIEDILPPLTSSNEIDLQLYAIIAIVVKDFVQAWYSKITPDHVFIEEVVQIIAHCSRAVEQRLRRLDIEELIFDEIAALVEAHTFAYRTAHETLPPSVYHFAPAKIYHSLNPHPAMSPFTETEETDAVRFQARNETIYRQLLVQGALAVLLPTEDLRNTCLRTLVSDIIADLILGQGISGKACEGWFLHETVVKIVDVIKFRINPKARGEDIEHDTRGRLEKFGLLSPKERDPTPHLSSEDQSWVLAWFWRVLQYVYLFILFTRFVVVGLFRARSLPSRSHASKSNIPSPIAKRGGGPWTPSHSWSNLPSPLRRPILDYRSFSLLSALLRLSTRMPWLVGLLSLCRHGILIGSGRLGQTDGVLERFLHNILTTYVTPWSTLLPTILLNLRITLFPFNSRGPPSTPPPDLEERVKIRRRAAKAILSLVPRPIARIYFATSSGSSGTFNEEHESAGREDDEEFEEMISHVEEMLDVFGDTYMNKHLVYNILELVLVRLVPEMGEMTPGELLTERGVVL